MRHIIALVPSSDKHFYELRLEAVIWYADVVELLTITVSGILVYADLVELLTITVSGILVFYAIKRAAIFTKILSTATLIP
jgi:hypothetical protein